MLVLAIVAVELGGWYMLTLVRGRQAATPFQITFSRAGHAHAGVLVILSLVVQLYVDASALTGVLGIVAREGVPVAAILMPAGFFFSSAGAGTTQPNRFIWLVYAGALSRRGVDRTRGRAARRLTAAGAATRKRGRPARPSVYPVAVRLRLIPREERFFDLFAEDAANVLAAARLLEAMLRSYDAPEQRAKEIRDAEHRGDELSHEIGRRLESTFVTPFDREDIHALISALDDVVDFIEESADTFILYRIEAPTAVAVQQASIIVKQCEQLHEALTNLRGFKGLEKYWIEVHRLENEGDQLSRKAIAGLFADGGHPIEIIKWKDVYAQLEAAIDKCEDVANIIERITIKHS